MVDLSCRYGMAEDLLCVPLPAFDVSTHLTLYLFHWSNWSLPMNRGHSTDRLAKPTVQLLRTKWDNSRIHKRINRVINKLKNLHMDGWIYKRTSKWRESPYDSVRFVNTSWKSQFRGAKCHQFHSRGYAQHDCLLMKHSAEYAAIYQKAASVGPTLSRSCLNNLLSSLGFQNCLFLRSFTSIPLMYFSFPLCVLHVIPILLVKCRPRYNKVPRCVISQSHSEIT
jgi:hypothetical protein